MVFLSVGCGAYGRRGVGWVGRRNGSGGGSDAPSGVVGDGSTIDLAGTPQRQRVDRQEVTRGCRAAEPALDRSPHAGQVRHRRTRAQHEDGRHGVPPLLVGHPDDARLDHAVQLPEDALDGGRVRVTGAAP